MKPAILFFDLPGVGHLQVVRRVVASGHPAVVNSPPLARALRAEGIPFHFWSDFQHDAVLARARERATCVAAELNCLLQDPGRRRAAFSPGCDEILRQAGGLFVERLLALIQDEVAAIEIFERLARDLPLGLLVLGCDNAHAQRALIGAARRRAKSEEHPSEHQ